MDFHGILTHPSKADSEATVGCKAAEAFCKAVEATIDNMAATSKIGNKAAGLLIRDKAAQALIIHKAAKAMVGAMVPNAVIIISKEGEAICNEDAMVKVIANVMKKMAKMEAGKKFSVEEGCMKMEFLSKDQIEKIVASPFSPSMPRVTPQYVFDLMKEDEPELAEEVRSTMAEFTEMVMFDCAERAAIRKLFGAGQLIPGGGLVLIREGSL